jgi:uncharacterized damage-inducible protein DinB
MQKFFTDIFEYHHHFNQKLVDVLSENENLLEKGTIQLFCHTLNAHNIWNSRILGKPEFGVQQLHLLSDCKKIDTDNLQETIEIINNSDFDNRLVHTNAKGYHYNNTIQEVLFHINNHSTHHKGQIIADLRLAGIEPLVTDYIFYKN